MAIPTGKAIVITGSGRAIGAACARQNVRQDRDMSGARKSAVGRPTRAEIEKRKERVLSVAERLFMSQGFAATSVAEIARQARVSPRMIVSHFGGKDEIFAQVIKDRSLRALIPALDAPSSGSAEDRLLQAAKALWTVAYSPGAIEFLRLAVAEGDRFETHTAEIVRSTSGHFRRDLEILFSDLHRNGLIHAPDETRIAKYFIDLIVGYSVPQAAMGYWERVPDENELRAKVRFFCLIVQAAARSRRDTIDKSPWP